MSELFPFYSLMIDTSITATRNCMKGRIRVLKLLIFILHRAIEFSATVVGYAFGVVTVSVVPFI